MSDPDPPESRRSVDRSCAFCGHDVPAPMPVVEGDGRRFCSRACRRAFEDGRDPFATAGGGSRRYRPGVDALTPGAPEGIPGNAAVLLAGEEGTRLQGILQECTWRALERGEPVVVLSMDRPPYSLVDSFLAHGWNVLPYLEAGGLRVVDLFTGRLHDASAATDGATRWNEHVRSVIGDAVAVVEEPADVLEVANRVGGVLDSAGVSGSGLVAVDYLTELALFAGEGRATNLIRELRALVCKGRYVPLVAGASVGQESDLYPTDFPHDHEYLFDGIVDLELDDRDDGRRIKRLSVRKLDDAPAVPRWFAYQFRPGAGFVTLGPDDPAPEE